MTLKEDSARPLKEKRGGVSKKGKDIKKRAKKTEDQYRQIKRKQKWKDIAEDTSGSKRGRKRSRFVDTDKMPKARRKGGRSQKKSIDVNFLEPLTKSAAYVKPFGDRVLHNKMSLKNALDKVPWWMQDDLLSYLRDKKKK